jgi:DNA-binding transcriptional LysR family regulator
MDIRQLKYFMTIAEKGNYARAAEVLHLTQSALTQSMTRLEDELEVRLFERGRFGAVLTDVGAALLHRARLITAEMQLAELEISQIRGATRGSVTVGLGKALASGPFAKALVQFAVRRPEVSLTINEGWSPDLFRGLISGEYDFVVSAPQPGITIDPELHLEVISHQVEMPIISVNHPLASKTDLQLADLSDVMWGIPPKGNGRIRRLREIFESLGLHPPIRFLRTDSDTLALAMISAGLLVGLANLDSVERKVRAKQLIVLPFEELMIDRRIVIATRKRSRLTSLAEAVVSELRAAVPAEMAAAQ